MRKQSQQCSYDIRNPTGKPATHGPASNPGANVPEEHTDDRAHSDYPRIIISRLPCAYIGSLGKHRAFVIRVYTEVRMEERSTKSILGKNGEELWMNEVIDKRQWLENIDQVHTYIVFKLA
ncbi:hypothetical protein FQR65_LT08714 [Abscondita terminalis]|nr:hypothetical protein FQR65_LT08714 [Abscondita terminalis]